MIVKRMLRVFRVSYSSENKIRKNSMAGFQEIYEEKKYSYYSGERTSNSKRFFLVASLFIIFSLCCINALVYNYVDWGFLVLMVMVPVVLTLFAVVALVIDKRRKVNR